MPLGEGELVEVVLRRLDFSVVPDLVAETDEGVFDLAACLRDRVQVAERQPLAGERDVDDVLGQGAVELGALQLGLASGNGSFDGNADGVQRHSGVAVAHLAERQLQVARAPEVADAELLELVPGRSGLDRAQRVVLQRLRVHGRDCIAFARHGPDSL